jgi:hypothetical protein
MAPSHHGGYVTGILILENTEGHSEHPISNHHGLFNYFECGDGWGIFHEPSPEKTGGSKGGLVGKPFSKGIPYGIPISNVMGENWEQLVLDICGG